ncbi:hypothetical protein AMELA_G00266940 [Ameiurus melas]|uniref:Uncharacterized protein n=1 Tax=Ameiurus melas TaxID=219545 RepID=A0A7J5ZRE2_AMEME|nr:hypothetical protein AMELA_G00266940 [Ameiurus melas]
MHLHQVLTGAVNPGDCCYSVGSVHDIPFTRVQYDVQDGVRSSVTPGSVGIRRFSSLELVSVCRLVRGVNEIRNLTQARECFNSRRRHPGRRGCVAVSCFNTRFD